MSRWKSFRKWLSIQAGRLPDLFQGLADPERTSRGLWILAILLCLMATLVVESRMLLTPGVLLGSNTDALTFHYPIRDFIHSCIEQRILPLWEPHIFNGQPLQTGLRPVLNPALLITALTPNTQDEMRATVLIHLFLTHLGALVWLRSWRFSLLASWLGGAVVAYSGFQLSHLFAGHYDILINLAWVPWVLWSVRLALTRSGFAWSFLAIFFWLILMTCGHYHVIYLSLWYIGVEFGVTILAGNWGNVPMWNLASPLSRASETRDGRLWQCLRGLLRFGFLGVAVGGLDCWQLMPTLETVSLSVRGSSTYANAIDFGAPPWAWLTFLVPHLYQSTMDLGSWCGWVMWEGQGFVGVLTLLIILYAFLETPSKKWAPHLFVAILAHWLALGDYAGLFQIYYKLDPFVGLFRCPSRFLWPATLATAWLAASGMQALLAQRFECRARTRKLLLALLGLQTVVWAALFYQDGTARWWLWFVTSVATATGVPGDVPPPRALYGISWTRYSNTVMLIGVFCYILYRLPQRARCASLCVAALLELTQFSRTYQQVAPQEALWLSPAVVGFFESHRSADRVCCEPGMNWQNHFGAYGLSEPTGYDNIMGSDYARQVLQELHIQPGSLITVYSDPMPTGLHRLQSTRYYLSNNNYFKNPELPGADRFADFQQVSVTNCPIFFYVDTNTLPRAYFVTGARKMDRPARGVRELEENWQRTRANVNLDGQNLALLQQIASQLGFEMSEFEKVIPDAAVVEEPRIRPNDVMIRCENKLPGVLILTDSPWPGWHALDNGKPVPILKSEADLHRAIVLAPGRHLIQFFYWPETLTVGLMMSGQVALALATSFVLLWLVARGLQSKAV